MDENLDLTKIVKQILIIKKSIEKNLPAITTEIEVIINRGIKSTQRIERILDTLLDYGQMEVGEKEFRQLNDYYASFNQENAAFYNAFYEEMNGEE